MNEYMNEMDMNAKYTHAYSDTYGVLCKTPAYRLSGDNQRVIDIGGSFDASSKALET